jgi:hypothetical protein
MVIMAFKAKLHIATSPFSFIEVEIEEETVQAICEKNDKLLKHYKNNQK